MEERKEERNKENNIEVYRLFPFGHHLKPRVEVESAEVRLEGRRMVVETKGVKAEIETKPLKDDEAEFLLAEAVSTPLPSISYSRRWTCESGLCQGRQSGGACGPRRGGHQEKHTQQIAYSGNAWRGAVNVHSGGDMKMYILRVEDVHYYFAVKTREGQIAAGGERYNRRVRINAETVANAINAISATRE